MFYCLQEQDNIGLVLVKSFADNNFKMTKMEKTVSKKVENITEKEKTRGS